MKTRTITALGLALSSAIIGCAASQGTSPNDMSAAEHQAAARNEEGKAHQHGAEYDPESKATRCTPGRGTVCWESVVNPTREHSEDASRHRELAAKHRAASQALLDAEAAACDGIPEADRDMSPFAHHEDVGEVSEVSAEIVTPSPDPVAVSTVRETRSTRAGKQQSTRVAGARVVFKAVPGMTQEWLQRVVDCHQARNAAIGFDTAASEMPHCPLALPGVKATVTSTGNGFAIDVRSDNPETAQEILRRTQKH